MSGRITIDNLSDSLKELINKAGLTEEQVLNLINENGLSEEEVLNLVKTNLTGDISQLSTQEKGSLVGAINELFQSANNGKELIANAIGEPLNAEDTFSAMSDDINGLLSTFKTNMMNNGIAVESSDRFKSLIDKIKGLTEGEGNKGIQFAEGSINVDQTYRFENVYSTHTFNFSSKLDFIPNYIFVRVPGVRSISVGYGTVDVSNAIITNKFSISSGNVLGIGADDLELYVQSVDMNGFTVKGDTTVNFGDSSYSNYYGTNKLEWCAIGIGEVEEDTTLRDSLASILEEEGVSVTEEDDMASLISKVDSEFNRQVVPAGTAVASDVLSDKTFINSTGQLVTGTMANRGGAQTVTPSTSNKTLYSGYYSGNITVKGDSNLKASNIVSGKSIFGVSGSAATQPSSIIIKTLSGGTGSTRTFNVSHSRGNTAYSVVLFIEGHRYSPESLYINNDFYLLSTETTKTVSLSYTGTQYGYTLSGDFTVTKSNSNVEIKVVCTNGGGGTSGIEYLTIRVVIV